jgi:mitogen-activated protein kinase kinase kinase 13
MEEDGPPNLFEIVFFKGTFHGRPVAVKKVNDLRDAECMRKISSHPNIVELYGVCLTPCCVVMEYCAGGSLADYLRRERSRGTAMKMGQVIEWARQVARGMSHLHARKILHRDLKSANVLITGDDVIKITDFGTCKDWSSVDSNDSVVMTFAGTIPWM